MYRYKSFISYSRAADSRLAPEIKSALQGFAKPWYQLRVFQVFCDQTNLTANPDLWAAIEKNLADSEYFIYLASPQAAQSKWVRKEIEFFHNKGTVQNVIIVLTGGTIVWDEEKSDFNWQVTDAVPNLSDVIFKHEPTWVDLSWIRKEQLSSRDPRFLDAIANLSSTLRKIDKDTLIGKDVEEHRRAKRFRVLSMTGLTLLALFLAAATIFALQSERKSQERLIRTYIGNGNALLETGDYLMALPWFVEAMADERNTEQKDLGEFRVQNLLSQVPSLVQVWQSSLPVLTTEFINRENILILSGDPVNWWTNEFDCVTTGKSSCKAMIRVVSGKTGNDVFNPVTIEDGSRQWAVSTDKSLFASLSVSNVLRVWSLADGKLVWELPLNIHVPSNWADEEGMNNVKDAFYCTLAFSKLNDKLLLTHHGFIKVYGTQNGKEIAVHQEVNSMISKAKFLEDENSIVFLNQSIKVWDINSNKVSVKKIPFVDAVDNFQLAPDNIHLAIAGDRTSKHSAAEGPSTDGVIAYIDLKNTANPLFIKEVENHASKLEFDAKGTVLGVNSSSTSEGGSLDEGTRVWNLSNGDPLTNWVMLSQEVETSFDNEGKKIIISCRDGTTQVWETGDQSLSKASNRVCLLHDGDNEVKSIISPDDRYLLTLGFGHLVKLWQLPGNEELHAQLNREFQAEEVYDTLSKYTVAAGSPDDTSNTNPSMVYVYETKRQKKIGDPLKHNSEVHIAEISKDGNFIATATLNGASIWQRDNQKKLYDFHLPDNAALQSLEFSADSKRVLTSFSDYTVRVWLAKTGQPLTPYIRHPSTSTYMDQARGKFSRDGKKVITSDGNTYSIWDASNGDPLSVPVKVNLSPQNSGEDSTRKGSRKALSSDTYNFKSLGADDIRNYAEIISNSKLDVNGSLVRLSTEEYVAKWKKLKTALKNRRITCRPLITEAAHLTSGFLPQ